MSFNQKIIAFALFVILATPFAGYYTLRHKRSTPKPIPPREEISVMIKPGDNLRDIADKFVTLGFASTTEDVYKVTGKPASLSPSSVRINMEGLLSPETIRVFADASLSDVVQKFMDQRERDWSNIDFEGKDQNKIVTMASLLEKEARTPEDRRLVSDILWRRLNKGWALQLDSTVHYAIDKTGTVFTTDKDRANNSLWNTYKYPGLPPGPICMPSLDSIQAAINPTKNDYWFFLTGSDGKMHYAKTLDEHNVNRYKYLR